MGLCYSCKTKYDIYSLFHTRYRLHKQVYNHPVSKSYEYIIAEIILKTIEENPKIRFIDLTDSVLTSRFNRSKEILELQSKIYNRKHHKLLCEFSINSDILIDEKHNKITEDILLKNILELSASKNKILKNK